MQYFLLFVLLSAAVQLSVAPPVNQKTKDGEHDSENEIEDVEERVSSLSKEECLIPSTKFISRVLYVGRHYGVP